MYMSILIIMKHIIIIIYIISWPADRSSALTPRSPSPQHRLGARKHVYIYIYIYMYIYIEREREIHIYTYICICIFISTSWMRWFWASEPVKMR